MPTNNIRPDSWLTELARLKPARWKWNRALRTAICIALPLALGMLSGYLALGVWMSIASLMLVSGESTASYRSRFKLIAISTSIGSLGCLVGYIGCLVDPAHCQPGAAVGLPWLWVVLIMAGFGFLGGVVSTYGAAFSLGSLQFLVLAAVAVGHPQIGPFWQATVYYIVGAAFYALVLGIEALVVRVPPQRKSAAQIVQALAQMAQGRSALLAANGDTEAQTQQIEAGRQTATSQMSSLYADLLGDISRRAGRASETDALWALLQCCDTVFARILSADCPKSLAAAAADLSLIATAIRKGKKNVPQLTGCDAGNALFRAVKELADAGLRSHSPFSPIVIPEAQQQGGARLPLRVMIDRLLPGSQTVHASLVLALCTGLAYAVHWFDQELRWYWVPLTIAIVVKPDYGSLFARSLLRCVGVLIGALIGSAILLLLPKNALLAIPIAICAAFIPWASQRSYALLGVAITPLILVLIDLTVPGSVNINYAGQRILGTVLASGIVLFFGYFLWPRTQLPKISESFRAANKQIAGYLLAAAGIKTTGTPHATAGMQTPDSGLPTAIEVSRCRRNAYASLVGMRSSLQKLMADPPPASREATAWLPIIASAERICDRITAYAVKAADTGQTDCPGKQQCTQIEQLAQEINNAPALAPAGTQEQSPPDIVTELVQGVRQELNYMHRLTDSQSVLPRQSASEH